MINSPLHISRDIRRNWFVEAPLTTRRARARFGRRVLDRALGDDVEPSLDTLLSRIDHINEGVY